MLNKHEMVVKDRPRVSALTTVTNLKLLSCSGNEDWCADLRTFEQST